MGMRVRLQSKSMVSIVDYNASSDQRRRIQRRVPQIVISGPLLCSHPQAHVAIYRIHFAAFLASTTFLAISAASDWSCSCGHPDPINPPGGLPGGW